MLLLDSSAYAISETGPVPVGGISNGSKVLCMSEGKPRWVVVRALAERESRNSGGVRVFTDGGDILIGADTALVTSNGLRSGMELAELREPRTVGRMEGSWPLVETADAPKQPPAAETAKLICHRLSAMSLLEGDQRPLFRVGSHSKRVLDLFERAVIGRRCSVEPGIADWTWLAPQNEDREMTGPRNKEILVECALALWQLPEEGRYRLPLEQTEIRSFTLAVLYSCGAKFRTDYRPRYSPLQVELELEDASTPHAAIQGVASLSMPALMEVILAERGCYMVVSGLLCGQ